MNLWKDFETWKEECCWVDLTRPLSPATPHWDGFPEMIIKDLYDYAEDGFQAKILEICTQFGTHVDPPSHFHQGTETLDCYTPEQMVMPLCVIDITDKIKDSVDYGLTVEDVKAWEAENGTIPAGAFVALRSDWSKRTTADELDNKDAEGHKHYPGWDVNTVKFLVEERNIASIGHETTDTDPAYTQDELGYAAEEYILSTHRFQIEVMYNLSQVPATGSLIFCGFPKLLGMPGSPARCYALCPKK